MAKVHSLDAGICWLKRKWIKVSNMSIFENTELGAKIRTIIEDDQVLFCASDVATALGYSNPRDAVLRSCTAVVKRDGGLSSGQVVEMNYILEPDLYRLIFGSKLESAQKFQNWVFDEVLPQIRKTGKYSPEPVDRETKIRTQYQNWMKIEAETLQILGFDLGWMRADAIERAHRIAQATGVDVLPKNLITNKNAQQLQWNFNPDLQLEYGRGVAIGANYINVTKWAEEFDLVTSKHLNVILERLGLQTKLMLRAGIYSPTEAGKLYAGTATISGKAKNAGKLKVTGWNVGDQRLLDLVIPEVEYLQIQLLENIR